ncbi:MAG: hypothetical protein E6H54_17660 [Betaproteobacteria bacterium]|nr:MAG: hypothetical protein E6H54_17660 [Betaproteobacteria bacterium]
MDNGIENRLGILETRLDTILPTLATKADVSEAKASLVMWLGSIVGASTAIVIAVLLFAINRAGL